MKLIKPKYRVCRMDNLDNNEQMWYIEYSYIPFIWLRHRQMVALDCSNTVWFNTKEEAIDHIQKLKEYNNRKGWQTVYKSEEI